MNLDTDAESAELLRIAARLLEVAAKVEQKRGSGDAHPAVVTVEYVQQTIGQMRSPRWSREWMRTHGAAREGRSYRMTWEQFEAAIANRPVQRRRLRVAEEKS